MKDDVNPYKEDEKAFSLFLQFSQQLTIEKARLFAKELISLLQKELGEIRGLKILEPGIGYGRIAIPLALEGAKYDFHIYGFDNSPLMLRELENRINRLPPNERLIAKERIKYAEWDAEQAELPYPPEFFDVVILFYILHYLRDWRTFLDKLNVISKKCFVFIKVLDPLDHWLDGNFEEIFPNDELSTLYEFWRTYYSWKEEMGLTIHKPGIRATMLQPALNYLKQKGYGVDCFKIYIPNTRIIDFSTLIEWIRYGVFCWLREGTTEERKKLAQRMNEWLRQKNISERTSYSIESEGFEICVARRN